MNRLWPILTYYPDIWRQNEEGNEKALPGETVSGPTRLN